MNNEVIKRVEELNLSLVELQKSSKRALGFTQTLEYKETFFHVSRLFVIADLSPLAYMDMSQEIVDGVIQTAVIALFERLRPLLECRHRWTPPNAGYKWADSAARAWIITERHTNPYLYALYGIRTWEPRYISSNHWKK